MSKARPAISTVTFIDEYCQRYQDLFPDVRSFEHFKLLQVGMLSEVKRKTLPAIAKVAGESDPQALHHFVAKAPWSVEELRRRRLTLLRQALAGRAFVLCIDETGDRKRGMTTIHAKLGHLPGLNRSRSSRRGCTQKTSSLSPDANSAFRRSNSSRVMVPLSSRSFSKAASQCS